VATQKLLDQLCAELGFCLPCDVQDHLISSLGTDADAFTDRVIEAEGLDPVLIDGNLRRQVRARVAAVLNPEQKPWPRRSRS
jgi:hypothetical protein